ncbi:hypothetical protein VF13_39070 [Nostoc linckia z16]|nr:hypothetical protein VF13_39070 [Nostoc linckia z16]
MGRSALAISLILFLNTCWTLGQGTNLCLFYDPLKAQQNIRDGKPKLFLETGIAPIRYTNDSTVEKQFGFVYEDLGDLKSESDSCLIVYSRVVFSYLDRRYGREWRRRCRKDVLFLKSIRYQSR